LRGGRASKSRLRGQPDKSFIPLNSGRVALVPPEGERHSTLPTLTSRRPLQGGSNWVRYLGASRGPNFIRATVAALAVARMKCGNGLVSRAAAPDFIRATEAPITHRFRALRADPGTLNPSCQRHECVAPAATSCSAHAGCFNAAVSIGSLRKRLPVAAKIALAIAGTMAEVPASPIPPGGSGLCTMWTSMAGASSMRRI
jgi:hypothetical protein